MMRYKIGNKSVNALVTPLFYLFYTGGFGEYYEPKNDRNYNWIEK